MKRRRCLNGVDRVHIEPAIMRRRSQLAQAGLLLLHLAQLAAGVEVKLTQSDPQQCSGMYSRKSWGGNIDPFILTKFLKPVGGAEEGTDTVVSLLVFEWKDRDLVATGPDGEAMVCDQAGVEAGRCGDDQLGEFVLADGAEERSNNEILTQAISLANPPAVRYAVRKTGYYCVVTSPFGGGDDQYTAVVEFRNAFGELPAAQIAKLPFYAALTIIYAFLALAWAALHYRHRADMLPVQHYVAAILGFLVLEMFTTWLFYDYQNRHGLTAGAKALLGLVSVLSAARNSFSFFLLLIVCMGYGVVRPSLGRTMVYVRALALTHFAFGVIYAIASLSVAPEKAGPLILLVVLPLAATLTAFYVWTLNALGATMKDLTQRRQTVKAAMYRKLWWCILASILVIFVFFFINSWAFAGTRQEDFVPAHWPTRWFILDGWLNLVYFFDVAFVAYLWRPTANNRRFAMSDEVRILSFLPKEPPQNNEGHVTNHVPGLRLLKMMTASKLPLWEATASIWTSKTRRPTVEYIAMPVVCPQPRPNRSRPPLTTLRRKVGPPHVEMSPRCPRLSRQNLTPACRGGVWMARRCLRWRRRRRRIVRRRTVTVRPESGRG